MKSMTCKELGGACDMRFYANTFEELAKQSKAHGQDMFEKEDPEHAVAMQKVFMDMQDPEKMKAWILAKKAEFEALEDE